MIAVGPLLGAYSYELAAEPVSAAEDCVIGAASGLCDCWEAWTGLAVICEYSAVGV